MNIIIVSSPVPPFCGANDYENGDDDDIQDGDDDHHHHHDHYNITTCPSVLLLGLGD